MVQLTIVLLQVLPQEEVQDQGLARDTQRVHPVMAEQGPAAGRCGPPYDQHTFDEYLRWLHRSTRTHIKPPYTEEAIDEDSKEDMIEDVYNVATRADTQLQRAPLQRYMVRYLNDTICYPFGIKYMY